MELRSFSRRAASDRSDEVYKNKRRSSMESLTTGQRKSKRGLAAASHISLKAHRWLLLLGRAERTKEEEVVVDE